MRSNASCWVALMTALCAAGVSACDAGAPDDDDGELVVDDEAEALAVREGVYLIKGVQSGRCLDVAGGSTENGANVQQWGCHGGANQQFAFRHVGGDVYEIKASHSGRCLDVAGRSTERGANVQQWSCNGQDNQRWRVQAVGGGELRLTAERGGKCLDVQGFSTSNGGNLQVWSCSANDNQRFRLTRVGGGGGGNEPSGGSTRPVFSESFEDDALGRYKGRAGLDVVDGCGVGGSKCLRARYAPTSEGSDRLGYDESLPPAKEYTAVYDLRFDRNFEWVKGGKLPGLGPENIITGCDPSNADGWSVRLMWQREGGLIQYIYHQDRTHACGDGFAAEGFRMRTDRWQAISVYVRVNDSASQRNGQVRLFVDGNEVRRQDNLRLRGVSSGGLVSRFLFSTFYGGSSRDWAPSRTTYAYFDNIAVYPGLRVRSTAGGSASAR